MKTPKEILLARHKAVSAKLDDVRRSVVTDLNAKAQRGEDAKSFQGDAALQTSAPLGAFASLRLCVNKLWRELVWPCRRTWSGLAAVWLAILVFNHSQTVTNSAVIAKSPTPPGEMRLALREQRRVLDELIGPTPVPVAVEPPRRPNHQPRSERRTITMA